MNAQDQINIWQQLIGTNPNLTEIYTEIRKSLEGKPNADGIALQRIHAKIKGLTRSKASAFTGIVVAKAESIDFNAYKWAKAKKLFDKDPGLAISGEYDEKNGKLLFKTNEKGEPLDCTERWPSGDPNKNFLKPIDKNSWTRYIDGVASLTKPDVANPTKADIVTRFILTLKGDLADPNSPNYFDPPEDTPIEFRALDKTGKDSNILVLNGAVVTKWIKTTSAIPPAKLIVEKFYADLFVPAHEILAAFEKKGKALVIVDGYVLSINREVNQKTGNRMIQITTMEMEDTEGQKMITGWVPKHVVMDFAEESEVRLIGTMDRRPVYEEGKPTGEMGDVNINIRAIQVLNIVVAPEAAKGYDPAKFNNTSTYNTMPANFMS